MPARFALAAIALLALAACAAQSPLSEDPVIAPLRTQPEAPPTPFDGQSGTAVFFADDSSELTDEARAVLDRQADWLLVTPDARFVVAGYSSDIGDRAVDLVLAQRRAHVVAEYLASRGVPRERISTRSYGQESQNSHGAHEPLQRRAEINVAYRMAAGADRAQLLPSFPWPPPEPTSALGLTAFFSGARNQMQVNETLVRALSSAGYGQRWSYYAIPNGFALVARIEHLNEDASPAAERFGLAESERRAPGLIGAVWGVFFPRVGYYRQVVFIVTDRSWSQGDNPNLTAEAAETILRNGADALPARFESMRFDETYRVTALIYEFNKREGEVRTRASAPDRARNPAQTHLEKAEIMAALDP